MRHGLFKLIPILVMALSIGAMATNDDEGIYCLEAQPNLNNAIKLLNTKFHNGDDFQVPLNQGSKNIEDAELLGVAIDSYYVTRWVYKTRLIQWGDFKVKLPLLAPTQTRKYNVCVAVRED